MREIEEAKKFFSYLKTSTSDSFDVSSYSDEELLDLYKHFKNDSRYRERYIETLDRMNADRKPRLAKKTREAELMEAFKFFSYLDTSTSRGYKLEGRYTKLSSDDVLKLYHDFKTDKRYRSRYDETVKKMLKGGRKIVIPHLSDYNTDELSYDDSSSKDETVAIVKATSNELTRQDDVRLEPLVIADEKIKDDNYTDFSSSELDYEDSKAKEDALNSLYGSDSHLDDLPTMDDDDLVEVVSKEEVSPSRLKKFWNRLKEDKKFRKKFIIGAVATAVLAGVVIANIVLNGDSNSVVYDNSVVNGITDKLSSSSSASDLLSHSNDVDLSGVNFDLSDVGDIHSNAYDAVADVHGLNPSSSVHDVYGASLFDTSSGKWIDTSFSSLDDLKDLANSKDGDNISVLLTNDSNMVGLDGNSIANANKATGFISLNDYINIVSDLGGKSL